DNCSANRLLFLRTVHLDVDLVAGIVSDADASDRGRVCLQCLPDPGSFWSLDREHDYRPARRIRKCGDDYHHYLRVRPSSGSVPARDLGQAASEIMTSTTISL